MTRVVVTGVGAVTPAGVGEDPLWDRLVAGRSCIGRIDRFDASRYDCQIAGQADDFVAGDWLPPRFTKKTDRYELVGNLIVKQPGFQPGDSVNLSEIDRWSVHYEMTFDIELNCTRQP